MQYLLSQGDLLEEDPCAVWKNVVMPVVTSICQLMYLLAVASVFVQGLKGLTRLCVTRPPEIFVSFVFKHIHAASVYTICR